MPAKKKQAGPMNLMTLMEQFDTDAECRAALAALRWPDGPRCPRCESDAIRTTASRNQYDCGSCGYQFSVTAGTVLHDSKLPLPKWFAAVYLMCESRKGISANQLKRNLGVTYKTAWYLTHRIRHAMAIATPVPLSGVVEVDETYVGGKVRGKGRGYRGNKTMVLGAIERGGEVRFHVDKRADRATLHAFIRSEVDDDAAAIFTDEWPAYVGIGDENTRHESVNHRAEEWVRGEVHTNTVESVWSLFKRSIIGSYHQLSEKHLYAYLDEMQWRFNNRDNQNLFPDTLKALLSAEALEYKTLTS